MHLTMRNFGDVCLEVPEALYVACTLTRRAPTMRTCCFVGCVGDKAGLCCIVCHSQTCFLGILVRCMSPLFRAAATQFHHLPPSPHPSPLLLLHGALMVQPDPLFFTLLDSVDDCAVVLCAEQLPCSTPKATPSNVLYRCDDWSPSRLRTDKRVSLMASTVPHLVSLLVLES